MAMGELEPVKSGPDVVNRESRFPGLNPLEEGLRLSFLEELIEDYQIQTPEEIRGLIPQYLEDIAVAVHAHPLTDEDTGIDREMDDFAALADFSQRPSQVKLAGWGFVHPDFVLEVMDLVRGEFSRIARVWVN